MAITNETQFKKELSKITKMLDAFVFMDPAEKAARLAVISNLTGRTDEMADPATRAMLLADLDALKASLVQHYVNNNVSTKYVNLVFREYALDDSDIFELGRLAAAFTTAPDDKKYEKLEELFAKYGEVIEKLKAKGIIGEDLKTDVGDMSRHKEGQFKGAISGANVAFDNLAKLQKDLADAHSEEDVRRVVRQIDGQLRAINSTNRTLARLRKKVGHIEPHQRSVQVKASQIKAARNQAMADR